MAGERPCGCLDASCGDCEVDCCGAECCPTCCTCQHDTTEDDEPVIPPEVLPSAWARGAENKRIRKLEL